MRGIEAASSRIAAINGVIDGIAFQTNILALNAAVEAARAGEQGRGFAVVAGEVRTLAQRSAAAAKEIKQLIDESRGAVEGGSRLVETAGSTLAQAVQAARSVGSLVEGISLASNQQSTGVLQINAAVAQLDTATQQNAAMVEESAAAAARLKHQAQALTQAVQIFKVKHA
jgi:methyl-accepting chemotaxis protein